MADSAVPITSGTGTNIDTRTEATNGNHRQVVVIGDPSTNAGVAPVDATAGVKVDLGADNDVTITSGTVTAVTAITNALPAGTNAIGKLSANSGVDIGDVDVTSSALPTGASTSAKQDTQITAEQAIQASVELIDDAVRAEDVASADAHKGVVMMAVRQDTPANTSGTDGDYEMPKMSAGRLWTSTTIDAALPAGTNGIGKLTANSGVDIGDVDITSIAAGDNNIGNVDVVTLPALPAGNNNIGDVDVLSVVPGTGATNLGKAIDTATGATDTGVLALATRDDALSALTPVEGDNIQLRVDANGALWTHDDALDAAIAGSELQVDVVGALPAGTNAIGKLAANSGVDIGDVDVTSSALPTGASTLAEQQTQTASLSVMDDWDNAASDGASISGDVAHDAADAGEPVKVGFKAYSPDGTTPGVAVAELDRTNGKADLDGRQYVNTRSPQWWSFHSDGSSALTDTSVKADPGDGFEIVITEIIFSTGAATACNIFFEEGASKILGPWYLEAVAGRGVVWRGEKHVTASTALTVTTSAAIAQSLDVQGYIQAV